VPAAAPALPAERRDRPPGARDGITFLSHRCVKLAATHLPLSARVQRPPAPTPDRRTQECPT